MTELTGQTINSYYIEDYVGKGGHGVVYKGHHIDQGKQVAIKILFKDDQDDDMLMKRLNQEAEIIRDLRHPNIVPLIESFTDDQAVYLVTPWLDGGDLRNQLTMHSQLSPTMLDKILTRICGALDAAHAANIIHRDVKPENILLDAEGHAYLMDFGFAKWKEHSNFSTAVGQIIGTLNYLSPEQITGDEITNQTDIFALGILIHEMLSGAHPYAHLNSRVQVMLELTKGTLPLLELDDEAPDLVDELNDLISRCTEKDHTKRYLTASSVANHFQEIITKY